MELPQMPFTRDGRTLTSFGARTTPDDAPLVAVIEAAPALPVAPAKGAR